MNATRIHTLFGWWGERLPTPTRAVRRAREADHLSPRIRELIAEAAATPLPPRALLAMTPWHADAEGYLSLSVPTRMGHPLAPFE